MLIFELNRTQIWKKQFFENEIYYCAQHIEHICFLILKMKRLTVMLMLYLNPRDNYIFVVQLLKWISEMNI